MKPLIRWTIGPVLPEGFRSLEVSLKQMRRIYGDAMDYVVCHNQLTRRQLQWLKGMKCDLYEQRGDELPIAPTLSSSPYHAEGTRACWKLYPPRLRLEAPEFVIDNDVVFVREIAVFRSAIQGSMAYPVLAAGRQRNYGFFDEQVAAGPPCNNGFFGLPAGMDFKSELLKLIPSQWGWTSFYDDQGLVVAAIHKKEPYILSKGELDLVAPEENLTVSDGYHFVGLNSNLEHKGWKDFKARSLRI